MTTGDSPKGRVPVGRAVAYSADLQETIRAGEVVRLMAAHAPDEGPNTSVRPGLTVYRFGRPVPLHWDAVNSLSLGVVAQGRKRVRIGTNDYYYDPFHYLVMTRGMRFQAEILQASAAKPFLSFVLQVDHDLVNDVLDQLQARTAKLFQRRVSRPQPLVRVTPFDQNMLGSVYRFLQSLDEEADRAVLTPMYVREIVYRLLHADQCEQLVADALQAPESNPVAAAIAYMREHLSEPITVADLGDEVCMSTSAFSRLFREATGVSPYQFLKQQRLDRARAAIAHEQKNVSEAACEAGYSSLSHFISEFKRHYGETPGHYAERLHDAATFAISESDSAGA